LDKSVYPGGRALESFRHCRAGLKREHPCAEISFRRSEKRTSLFESAGVSA
jgi:hypothetical protein